MHDLWHFIIFSKITFYWKLLSDCCDKFYYLGSIVYLSCFYSFKSKLFEHNIGKNVRIFSQKCQDNVRIVRILKTKFFVDTLFLYGKIASMRKKRWYPPFELSSSLAKITPDPPIALIPRSFIRNSFNIKSWFKRNFCHILNGHMRNFLHVAIE